MKDLKPGDLILVQIPGQPRECDEIGIFLDSRLTFVGGVLKREVEMCDVIVDGKRRTVMPGHIEKIK